MGASESKMSVASTPKVEPSQRPKAARVALLSDPRSPSCAIDRTPIQVGVACSLPVVESVGPVFVDPRSPTPGITRTPMKVSVTSLARKLSTFFLNDVKSGDSSVPPLPPVSFTKQPSLPNVDQQNCAGNREPLLKAQKLATLSGHTDAMSTPALSSTSEGYGSICSSPFVLIGNTQMEVEVDAETSLEEAEEALLLGASPLRKELSLSLLACREGVYSSSLEERPLTPLPPAERQGLEDHSYALFTIASQSTESEASVPVEAVVAVEADEGPSQTPEEEVTAALPEPSHEQPDKSTPPTPQPPVPSSKSSPVTVTQVEPVQPGMRSLKFDPRSPSQAIFKPQWLGVGFGTTGVRARGVQGRGKTSVSSPLTTRNKATNENNNMVVRTKQRPRDKVLIGEGRSPLQILREANSPRDRNSQMKLKVSTPEKQRFSQMDRRALILSLDKENE